MPKQQTIKTKSSVTAVAIASIARQSAFLIQHSIMLYFKVEILLLLSVVLGVKGQCPAQCRCPSSQVANCASLALKEVPTDR